MQDSFIMYGSFHEALKDLTLEQYGKIMYAINEYALNDIEIELSTIEKMAFTLIKPQIDANKKRYNDGKKGGRPNNTKITTVENEEKEKPVVIENEEKEKPVVFNFSENKKPNNNVNVNVNDNSNVNENENLELINQNENEKAKFFLKLWNENSNIFGIAMQITRPKDFYAYFQNENITKEFIQTGMENYIQAINTGQLNKKYIPSTPDRFILNNTLSKYQDIQQQEDNERIAL